ncbi:HYC_CC_PP family protein [Algivirga pacifica]|uniref:Uncharacterized protein n=1 Tax=Algivirga pacifica TaxID=1162670 RepID=A0ABP9DCQ1_9BACT
MKAVVSILLAMSVLLGNLGFSVATHFCGEVAVESEVALGVHHLGCGMQNMEANCEEGTDGKESITRADCCSDLVKQLQLEDSVKVGNDLKWVLSPAIIVATIHHFFQAIFSLPTTEQTFNEYVPPLLRYVAYVLHQSFLL